ncbi:MAG: tripartite tricarboxylate transporter permease [Desulfosudis oleivorans]|nr:tripartite tricarboxylate transporter permease [Desulfosudis oleivorans]
MVRGSVDRLLGRHPARRGAVHRLPDLLRRREEGFQTPRRSSGKGPSRGSPVPRRPTTPRPPASFIPLLTLGIPGNATIAMIFAALMIHGVTPGPLLITEKPEIFWGVVASMYIGNGVLLLLNLSSGGDRGCRFCAFPISSWPPSWCCSASSASTAR